MEILDRADTGTRCLNWKSLFPEMRSNHRNKQYGHNKLKPTMCRRFRDTQAFPSRCELSPEKGCLELSKTWGRQHYGLTDTRILNKHKSMAAS